MVFLRQMVRVAASVRQCGEMWGLHQQIVRRFSVTRRLNGKYCSAFVTETEIDRRYMPSAIRRFRVGDEGYTQRFTELPPQALVPVAHQPIAEFIWAKPFLGLQKCWLQ